MKNEIENDPYEETLEEVFETELATLTPDIAISIMMRYLILFLN